ncbi:MAG: dihydropteroate synthase [Ignavibacteriales bacterium]
MGRYRVVSINNRIEAELYLREIGADEMGIKIMIPKAVFRAIRIRGVSSRAANLIKQEMLAKGGEAALGRGAASAEGETDVLLMGTLRQYELLIDKLSMQPFGLKKIARSLNDTLIGLESTGPKEIRLADGSNLTIGERTLVMGILNVTPDSFSDGGNYYNSEAAIARAREMLEQGADIIDIGGVSTRPGAAPVDRREEMDRILPVLEALRREFKGVPISIDTFDAEVARAALAEGASLINDVGGLKADSDMAGVISKNGCPVVVMHNRLGGGYGDLMAEVINDLEESLQIAEESGIEADQVIIDPGVGFGKTPEQNLVLLKTLSELKVLDRPILLGVSRKSFIGKILDIPPQDRIEGSVAAAIVGITNGASIIRVHDVLQTKHAVMVCDAIMRA